MVWKVEKYIHKKKDSENVFSDMKEEWIQLRQSFFQNCREYFVILFRLCPKHFFIHYSFESNSGQLKVVKPKVFFFPFCWWLVSEQMGSVYFLWDRSYCAKSCLHLTQISTLIGSLNKTSRTDLLGDSSSESKIQRHGKFSHML